MELKSLIRQYPMLELEDSIAEVEGVLKLIGEAYQQVVETDHAESTAAMGLQLLRQRSMARLRQAYEAVQSERSAARDLVKASRKKAAHK